MPEKYTAKDDSVGEMMLEMLNHIYNCKYINEVTKYYYDNAVVHFICDKDLNGYDEIQERSSASQHLYQMEALKLKE